MKISYAILIESNESIPEDIDDFFEKYGFTKCGPLYFGNEHTIVDIIHFIQQLGFISPISNRKNINDIRILQLIDNNSLMELLR